MTDIVVIDDDGFLREWVIATLKMNNYEAVGAPDGDSGFKLIKDYVPSLVLCDVNIPLMDGYAVLEQVRADQRTANIPFIFMTARSERTDMRRGMELGADDYLTKPFTPHELVSAIKAQLQKRQNLTASYETTLDLLRNNIVYALPHELRTPLTGSLGYAEVLRVDAESFTPDEVRDIATQIVNHNERLHHVLENFLAYAQIEVMAANPEQLTRLRNHLTPHVGHVISEHALLVAERHERQNDLVLEVDDFEAQIASRDLVKIVDELIDNAFKFSKPDTPVTVRVNKTAESFSFSVCDHGRGMTAEQQTLVGAYMQFNRALYEQQGLGFGLIIAKRLTELHRGRLIIKSTLGVGTEVTIRCTLHD